MLRNAVSQLPTRNVPVEQVTPELLEEAKRESQSQVSRVCSIAIEAVSGNPPHALKEDRAHSFNLLIKKILKDRNLDLRHYHLELLKRRLALRVHSCQLNSYIEYMAYLDKNPREYDKLFATLCINVSEFFRDLPVWVTMRYLLETLMRSKLVPGQEGGLKIWSAGCANGEEPFSLAILCREVMRQHGLNVPVKIFATDIDKECLAFCEKAEYAPSSLKNLDKELIEKYFLPAGDNFRPRLEVRNLVRFSYLDLTSTNIVYNTDLVTCRNVFIYFKRELQIKIIEKFHEALLPRKFLVLGKTELLPQENNSLFDELDASARIYKKK
jgi:chemotaxis methyl-accepting protein methylase